MQFNFIEYQPTHEPTHEQWHDCSTKESNIEIHKIYQAFLIYYIPESNKSGYDPHFSFSRVSLKNLQNFSQSSTFVQWELQASHMASQVTLVVKDSPANARDVRDAGLIPGSGRSPGGGHGNPLQYSCLKNPWTEEPARLQSIGSQTVRDNWSNLVYIYTIYIVYINYIYTTIYIYKSLYIIILWGFNNIRFTKDLAQNLVFRSSQ